MSTSKYSLKPNPYSRKIKDNKQHTINEGRKVNESLKQFQDKFIALMNQLAQELNIRIDEETEYMEQ